MLYDFEMSTTFVEVVAKGLVNIQALSATGAQPRMPHTGVCAEYSSRETLWIHRVWGHGCHQTI